MIVLFDDTVVGTELPRYKAIYNKVERKIGLKFDPQYRYSVSTTEEERIAEPLLRKMGYELKYFSGCFNPYLCKRRSP